MKIVDGLNPVCQVIKETVAHDNAERISLMAGGIGRVHTDLDLNAFVCLKGHLINRLPLPIPPKGISEPFHCDMCKRIYLRHHDGRVTAAPKCKRMF